MITQMNVYKLEMILLKKINPIILLSFPQCLLHGRLGVECPVLPACYEGGSVTPLLGAPLLGCRSGASRFRFLSTPTSLHPSSVPRSLYSLVGMNTKTGMSLRPLGRLPPWLPWYFLSPEGPSVVLSTPTIHTDWRDQFFIRTCETFCQTVLECFDLYVKDMSGHSREQP